MVKIVTYTNHHSETIKAMTLAEFRAAGGLPEDWDEFVWQDEPSIEAAIARHDQAFEAWRDDTDAGRPIMETY